MLLWVVFNKQNKLTNKMKPGDKVVCVDNVFRCGCTKQAGLTQGNVYVIEHVQEAPSGIGLLLLGHRPEPHICGKKSAKFPHFFRARRFRLLDELKQEARQKQQQSMIQ